MSEEIIRLERDGEVAIIRLTRGVTHPINLELIRRLSGTLKELTRDPSIRGAVLTGDNEKFLSIGFDLPELIALSRAGFEEFFRAFCDLCLELYAFPKPTAAAVTGHAVAGGCILSLCCDYRMIAAGRKMTGLNEIKLGVPLPYVADRILRDLVGSRSSREINYTGDYFEPEAALRLGLVDEILPLEDVVPATVRKIRTLGSSSPAAFAEIKRIHTESVLRQVAAGRAEADRVFLDCWFSPEAQERLREAVAKF